MRRRALLASLVGATTVIAGCGSSGGGPGTPTTSQTETTVSTTSSDAGIDVPDGSDADLIEHPLSTLVLEQADFENPNHWVKTETSTEQRTRFERSDEQQHDDPTAVTGDVFRFDSLAAAKDKYSSLEERANSYVGVTPTSVDLGVTGIGYILSDASIVVFRDANVVAQVTYSTSGFASDATIPKARSYGARLYADWR